GDAAPGADVRVPGPADQRGDPPDPRLPGAPDALVRRTGELHVGDQGTDDLPRDRLRSRTEDPWHGHRDRDVDGEGRRSVRAVEGDGRSVPRGDAGGGWQRWRVRVRGVTGRRSWRERH